MNRQNYVPCHNGIPSLNISPESYPLSLNVVFTSVFVWGGVWGGEVREKVEGQQFTGRKYQHD
jgi:hypothetical protein